MNEHALIRQKLILAASGVLTPKEHSRVQQHTSECEACRIELETWSLYTQSLQRLPYPPAPSDLIQRTQSRMLSANAALAHQRKDSATSVRTLSFLSAFAWAAGFAFWIPIQIISGFGALEGFLASTALVWITVCPAVIMFHRGGRIGRMS
jgi:anti-sigma factor RsiW